MEANYIKAEYESQPQEPNPTLDSLIYDKTAKLAFFLDNPSYHSQRLLSFSKPVHTTFQAAADNRRSFYEEHRKQVTILKQRFSLIPQGPFKKLEAPFLNKTKYNQLLDFNSDDLLAIALGGIVYSYDTSLGQVCKITELPFKQAISVKWLDDYLLAIGTNDGVIELFDAVKEVRVRTIVGHQEAVRTLDIRNKTLFSGADDRLIISSDLRKREAVCCFVGHEGGVNSLRFSQDDYVFATSGRDRSIRIWDVRGGKQKAPIMKNINVEKESVSLVANINLFDFDCKQEVPYRTSLEGIKLNSGCKAFAWSPLQRGVLYYGTNGEKGNYVGLYHTGESKVVRRHSEEGALDGIFFSKHDRQVVLVNRGQQTNVVIKNTNDWDTLGSFGQHSQEVTASAINRDGTVLVTGNGVKDENLCFWRLGARKEEFIETEGVAFR